MPVRDLANSLHRFGLIGSHPAITFPITRHHGRAARLNSMLLSVLLRTTDKS